MHIACDGCQWSVSLYMCIYLIIIKIKAACDCTYRYDLIYTTNACEHLPRSCCTANMCYWGVVYFIKADKTSKQDWANIDVMRNALTQSVVRHMPSIICVVRISWRAADTLRSKLGLAFLFGDFYVAMVNVMGSGGRLFYNKTTVKCVGVLSWCSGKYYY